jgi:16S rRNA (guanine527-N7)-methyltransferase
VQPDRIAQLLAPFLTAPPGVPVSLTDRQLRQVSAYLDLLLRWNARINLTAVRDAESVVTRHFGESFFAARQFEAFSGRESRSEAKAERESAGACPERSRGEIPTAARDLRVIDLGSGAGFPGLPLKIFAPNIALTLIESSQKKAAFLKEVVRTLSLMEVDVFAGRAENFPSTGDLVTLRAVERYERVLETAARLVAPGGRLALLIGAPQAAHTPQLLPAFSWQSAIRVPQSLARVVLIGTNRPEQESPA